jgi:hypothetical protein
VRVARYARWLCKIKWGVPLTAIILDPLAHFSGIGDIGSFSENTKVSKALIELALRAKCLACTKATKTSRFSIGPAPMLHRSKFAVPYIGPHSLASLNPPFIR